MAETTGKKQGFTWRHIMVVFTCAIGIFTSTAITFSCAGLTYVPISEQMGIERIQITFYMTCTYLAEVVFSPVVGAMLERLDIRIVAVSCAAAAALAEFLMSTNTIYWQWYYCGVLLGYGQIGILWLIMAGVIGRWYKDLTALMIGICSAMTGIGGAVFNIVGQTVLGPNLLTEETWRDLYRVFCICIIAGTIPWQILFLRSHPGDVGLKAYGELIDETVEVQEEEVLYGFAPTEAYKTWYFWALCVFGATANVCGIYPQHFTAFYQGFVAIDNDSMQAAIAAAADPSTVVLADYSIPELMAMSGTLEAFAMVGMAVGKVVTGAVESKSMMGALILGLVTGVGGIFAMWMGGTAKILPILWGGGFIYGCMYAWVTVVLPWLTRQLFGDLHYDQIYSVVLIPTNLVGAFAAGGLALIYQGPGWSAYWVVAIAFVAVSFLLALVIYKVGRPKYVEKFGERI